jgi:hypothetical protein
MKRPSRHYVCPCLGVIVNGQFEPHPELLVDPQKFLRDAIQEGLRHAAVFEAYRERAHMKKKSTTTSSRILQ